MNPCELQDEQYEWEYGWRMQKLPFPGSFANLSINSGYLTDVNRAL